jgi:hypothetical protein
MLQETNVAIDADRMRRVRPAEVALTDLNDAVAAPEARTRRSRPRTWSGRSRN